MLSLLLIGLKGLLMGIAIAAPVGPIALLCIRRTLAQGRWIGLFTGLGAATADGLYGMIAAFGLSAISELLVQNTHYLQLFGGIFLVYLGLTTFFAKSAVVADDLTTTQASSQSSSQATNPYGIRLVSAYSSTLALTLTNPATILSFIAIFAGLGITHTHYLYSVTLVLGVFAGSAGWWLVLVSGVIYLRNRFTPERLARFNQWSTKVFGVLIIAFGIAALAA
ncbi:MAG: LysE family translocator [Phormidesmis sp.]